MHHARGIGLHHRRGGIERCLAAAAHDRERTVLRARFATRDGSVEAEQAEPVGLDRQLARDARRNGGVIDEQRALLHRIERAVAAERHLREIVVVADAGQDDIGVLRGLGRGRCRGSAMLPDPCIGLGAGAIIDGEVMARLDEVACHRSAHDTCTDEADTQFSFAHAQSIALFASCARWARALRL